MSELRNKPVLARAQQFIAAWRLFAPEVELAAFKLSDLELRLHNAQMLRTEILNAETALNRLRFARDQGEKELSHQLTLVAYGVRGHEDLGQNCAMYRGMGYVTSLENRSGRPRKAKTLKFPVPTKE
jgi:hypothetical protein